MIEYKNFKMLISQNFVMIFFAFALNSVIRARRPTNYIDFA